MTDKETNKTLMDRCDEITRLIVQLRINCYLSFADNNDLIDKMLDLVGGTESPFIELKVRIEIEQEKTNEK